MLNVSKIDDDAISYVAGVITNFIKSRDSYTPPKLTPLSANVQARRVGCIIALLKLIGDGTTQATLMRQDNNPIWKDIEWDAPEGGKTGFHVKGESFLKHYLDLLSSLNLITREGILYRLTSHGKILQENGGWGEYNPDGADFSKRFMFLWITISDPLSTVTCISLLLDSPKTLAELTRDYYPKIQSYIQSFSYLDFPSTRFSSDLKAASNTLNTWKKPEVYSEHLVPSKINLLLDLGIVRYIPDSKTYSLSTESAAAFNKLKASDFVYGRHEQSITLCNQLFQLPAKKNSFVSAMLDLCSNSQQITIKLIDFTLYITSSLQTSHTNEVECKCLKKKGGARLSGLRIRHNISTYEGQSYINLRKTSEINH